MTKPTALLIIVFLYLLSGCKSDKINLELNLEEGSKHEMTIAMITPELGDEPMMEMVVEDEIVKKNEDGSYDVKFTYKSMKMNFAGISYDSDSYDDSEFGRNMNDQIGGLFNNPIKGRIDKDGKTYITEDISQWEGMKNASPDVIKEFSNSMGQSNVAYPSEPVGIGDSWTATVERAINGRNVDLEMTYTLTSITDDEIKIELEGNMDRGSMGSFKGMLVLDPETNYVLSSELNMDVAVGAQSSTMKVVIKVRNI